MVSNSNRKRFRNENAQESTSDAGDEPELKRIKEMKEVENSESGDDEPKIENISQHDNNYDGKV